MLTEVVNCINCGKGLSFRAGEVGHCSSSALCSSVKSCFIFNLTMPSIGMRIFRGGGGSLIAVFAWEKPVLLKKIAHFPMLCLRNKISLIHLLYWSVVPTQAGHLIALHVVCVSIRACMFISMCVTSNTLEVFMYAVKQWLSHCFHVGILQSVNFGHRPTCVNLQ